MSLRASITNQQCSKSDKCWFDYIVLLSLEPVKRVFSSVGAISGSSVEYAIGLVDTTTTRSLRCCNGDIRSRTCHIASKAVHVV